LVQPAGVGGDVDRIVEPGAAAKLRPDDVAGEPEHVLR
jgi:hypothetical protein